MARETTAQNWNRRLLLFKWLMILVPPVAVLMGHSLLGYVLGYPAGHTLMDVTTGRLTETLLLATLALVVAYIFAETTFRVLRRLQGEALAREHEAHTMNAVIQERDRLSRELHDGAAQLVADLLLRLDIIKELVEANRPQEAQAELERLHGAADEIYADIGDSIAGLRTDVTERGLVRALQDYLDQFEERYQVCTRIRADDTFDQLSAPEALQIFRFIQEALTNVRKHARAGKATISLVSDGPDQLKVAIADDGKGFTAGSLSNSNGQTLGLTSMRERVKALGGTFHVDSQPGTGTHVTATIPISRKTGENNDAALAAPAG